MSGDNRNANKYKKTTPDTKFVSTPYPGFVQVPSGARRGRRRARAAPCGGAAACLLVGVADAAVGSPAGSSRALVARLTAVEAHSRAETCVVTAAAAATTTTAPQLRMRTRLVCASRDEERALSPAFGSPARAARMLSLRVRSHPARALATRALSLPALAARSRRALSLSPHARSRCPRSRRPQVLSARALATRVFSSPALAACSRRPPALAVRMLCHARRSAGAAGLELALHHRPFTAQHAQSCHARSGPGEGYPAPPSRATPKRHSYVATIGLRRMLGVVM